MWRSGYFLRCSGTVIGCQAGNPVARLGHPVRRFVRKQLSDTGRRSLRPVEDVDGTSRGLRDLLKPFAFAVAVTGVSFTAASIWQYETFRQLAKQNQQRFSRAGNSGFYGKAGDFRHRLNAWWNRLYPAEKLICGIIGTNVVVFLAWRVPQFTTFMTKYFMASPMAKASCLPMLLSTFSHYSFLHLFVNMYVLWSFAPVASAKFGKEQFLATYLSAGVVSGFASYVYKVIRCSMLPSVGASGAILALIGIVGTSFPDTRLSVAFVSKIYPHSFSAASGMKAIILLDTLGVLFGWRFLDHAGHLGGMLFGIWYAQYGHQIARKYRDVVVQYWHQLRGKP